MKNQSPRELRQGAIADAKAFLIEALHHLNTWPTPTTEDIAMTFLFLGRAGYTLLAADPKGEALERASEILKEIPVVEKERAS